MISVRREVINRIIIFSTSYFAYAFMHATRKTLSSVKPLMIANLVYHVDKINITIHPKDLWYNSHPLFISSDDAAIFMGALDFLFMFSYALGLFIAGRLGDRIDPRHVLFGGMVCGAAITFLFGVPSQWGHFYNKYWYGILWFANGFLQAPGWPAGVSIIAHSFPSARGLILGFWSTSAGIGNIIGALLSSAVIDYGYEYVFLTTSCLLAGMAFLVLTAIPPAIVQSPTIPECVESPPQVSLFQILCLPELVCYALAYACLKLVNYSFFFWLPFYLNNKFNWDAGAASALAAFYDLGGLFGGIAGGGISDLPCVSRSCVNIAFLLLCIPCLLIYRITPGTPWALNGFVMSLTGFIIAGPANLLSAVFGTDLAAMPHLQGKRVLSTMTGFIDGTGSLGAAAGQILIPVLQAKLGWNAVFHLFMGCCALTLLFVLIPPCLHRFQRLNEVDESEANLISAEE
ncbi:unnamed protein product [Hymenolepis diminuta]|uniref:Sugar phosphate exchanger 3 n=2 Tax=Hymenolepis diminuta TaxID=6216 RepID=A0A564YVG8_HYMDI|nr:unnamed protein product [Hymenolepis diminuta]